MRGSRIAAEALGRGHAVHGFTRDSAPGGNQITWKTVNLGDVDSVSAAIAPVDVVVSAISTGDFREAVANASALPDAARTLLAALERSPETRLITVGGAGSLEVAPGLQVCDTEGFAETLPQSLGTPVEYIRVIEAHREALEVLRLSNRRWTYVSPSAGLVTSGQRTGRFRVGGDQLLRSPDGGPAGISAEDLAVAVLDEIEEPAHVQRRFTVGY